MAYRILSRSMAAAACCAAVLMFAAPQPAHAVLLSGEDLLAACTQAAGTPRRSICLGYIAAIADALADKGVGGRKACFPDNAKLSAMRDAVVQYLNEQASAAAKPGSDAITVALVNRFSCR